ncbi:MAG: amidohydrolase, partial [Ignavibacteria bacterium]
PKPGLEEKVKAVYECINTFHYYGITGISDISQPDDIEVFKKLYERGKLKLRINSYLPFNEFNNLQKHNESIKDIDYDFLRIKGFKEYYDGALGSETALFKENYTGKSYNGYKTKIAESGKLYELAKEIDKEGRQIIIHAIGDKAVSDVLDICEMLTRENGIGDRRMRIEHAQHIDEADFERFKKLGVIASVQPIHLKYDEKKVKEKLSSIIIKRTHNYKHLLNRGVTVNFGTDFPIAEINPYENIQLAVTRKVSDEIFFPENRINLHNCVEAYTINNAYAGFNEDKRGTIEKGKLADFLLMEDNIFEITEDEIKNSKVWKTYLNGEEIYCSE